MSLQSWITALVCTAMLSGTAQPVAAQSLLQYRDWQLVRGPETCRIVSVLASQASGAILLEATLLPAPPDPDALRIALRVPVGADLASGIALRHAGAGREAIGLDWLSCDREMCTAGGELSAQALGRLRRGTSVFVGFRPMPGARPVNLELSLMGFTAAYRALASCVPG